VPAFEGEGNIKILCGGGQELELFVPMTGSSDKSSAAEFEEASDAHHPKARSGALM
jgi:hypothetical protein